jgi:Spy/CpxP family protein refolding chaperone
MGSIDNPFDRSPEMKPWIKRTVLGAFVGLVTLGGLAACGHRPHGPMSDEQVTAMRGKAVDRIAGKLDLSEAQKAKLGVLADELIAQRKAMRGSGEPKAELQSLIAGTTLDSGKAQAWLDQKTQAVQAGSPKVIAALGDFYDSLNAEQQAQVRQFMSERRHGGWWGRG